MLAMLLCIVFGARFDGLSTPSEAMYLVFLSIVVAGRLVCRGKRALAGSSQLMTGAALSCSLEAGATHFTLGPG